MNPLARRKGSISTARTPANRLVRRQGAGQHRTGAVKQFVGLLAIGHGTPRVIIENSDMPPTPARMYKGMKTTPDIVDREPQRKRLFRSGQAGQRIRHRREVGLERFDRQVLVTAIEDAGKNRGNLEHGAVRSAAHVRPQFIQPARQV